MAMITRNLNFKRDLFNEQKANVRGISTGVVYVELLDAHSSDFSPSDFSNLS